MLTVPVVAIGLRPVSKIEHRAEVIGLCAVDRFQRGDSEIVFRQQTFLNDFRHILAGQLHALFEASLDLRKVVGFFLVHLPNDQVHIFLGRHQNPCLSVAACRETFCNRLQIGHQFGRASDVLPHFIDIKIEPEPLRFPSDVLLDLFGKVFN